MIWVYRIYAWYAALAQETPQKSFWKTLLGELTENIVEMLV